MPGLLFKVVTQITGGDGTPPDYNILYLGMDGDTIPQAQAMINALGAFYTSIKPYYPTAVTISVGTSVITQLPGVGTIWSTAPVTMTGTDTTGRIPPQLAVVVSWRTPTAGASSRGRTYLGPFGPAAMTTLGQPMPAFTTALNNAASTLLTALPTAAPGGGLWVWSRAHGVAYPVTSFLARTGSFHTQRRRAAK